MCVESPHGHKIDVSANKPQRKSSYQGTVRRTAWSTKLHIFALVTFVLLLPALIRVCLYYDSSAVVQTVALQHYEGMKKEAVIELVGWKYTTAYTVVDFSYQPIDPWGQSCDHHKYTFSFNLHGRYIGHSYKKTSYVVQEGTHNFFPFSYFVNY